MFALNLLFSFCFHFDFSLSLLFHFGWLCEDSKSNNVQSWHTSWHTNLVFDVRFYRTNSHFGFRAPTQMINPKHFHFPDQMVCDAIWMDFLSKTIHRSDNVGQCTGTNTNTDQLPPIKCSLCKCSNPRKPSQIQSIDSFGNNGISQSIDNSKASDIQPILTLDNQTTEIPLTIQRGHHLSKRFIVRIVTNTN